MNVFAAGDLVPGPQLAICAASDGAIAALAIHKSLVPATRKLERLNVDEGSAQRPMAAGATSINRLNDNLSDNPDNSDTAPVSR